MLDQNQCLKLALDVARGMEFLHTMEPLIPNLHLNSKHIMVGDCGSGDDDDAYYDDGGDSD